jgi:NitT/TauT family transport system permease protein
MDAGPAAIPDIGARRSTPAHAAIVAWSRRALPPLLTVVALLGCWQLSAMIVQSSYLPPLTEVFPALWDLLQSGDIYADLAGSLERLATAFAVGVAIGIPIGLISGRSKGVENFLAPLLGLFYPVPKAALMPVMMLWFGAGDLSKIIVIAMTVSLPLIYHSQQGARSVDTKLLWSAQAIGCGRTAQFMKIVLPASLPEILLGARVAIVLGVIVMVTSEMIVRQVGLGNEVFTALDMGQYAESYAVILVIAALGFALDVLFEAFRRRLTHWAPERRDAGRGG